MSEIKLHRRYPESRLEDVTDAYMRGFEFGRAMRMDENEKLRELVRHMHDCIDSYGKATGDFGCNSCPRNNDTGECDFDARMRELGVEI